LEPGPDIGGGDHEAAVQNEAAGISHVETGSPGLVTAEAAE
jgi:hypothetical protein